MFRILIVSIFYVCSSLPAAVGDNSATEDFGFAYSLKANGNGTVRYVTPEYSLESVIDADGNTFKRPVFLNASQLSDPGQPDLPSSSTFIAIDPEKTYSVNVNIISSRFTDDIEILPKNCKRRLEANDSGVVAYLQVKDLSDKSDENIKIK